MDDFKDALRLDIVCETALGSRVLARVRDGSYCIAETHSGIVLLLIGKASMTNISVGDLKNHLLAGGAGVIDVAIPTFELFYHRWWPVGGVLCVCVCCVCVCVCVCGSSPVAHATRGWACSLHAHH